MNMRKIVIIPAYNEEKNIGNVLRELKECWPDCDVLVINDGSLDGTAPIAKNVPGVTVVSVPFNSGIGVAVQTGLMYAKMHGYHVAIRIDGDGQHNPQEITKLLDPVMNGEADVAIGSRFLERKNAYPSIIRRIGQKIIASLLSLVIGKRITDSTSGFRVYNENAIDLLCAYYPVDYPEPEEILFLAKNNFIIKEFPVSIINREQGKSSITAVRSAYYIIKILLVILISILRTPIIKSR